MKYARNYFLVFFFFHCHLLKRVLLTFPEGDIHAQRIPNFLLLESHRSFSAPEVICFRFGLILGYILWGTIRSVGTRLAVRGTVQSKSVDAQKYDVSLIKKKKEKNHLDKVYCYYKLLCCKDGFFFFFFTGEIL